MMDAELKAKWIAALRSGEYEQGRYQLREGGKYCCLGVLCVVAGLPLSKEGDVVDGAGDYGPIRDLIQPSSHVEVLYSMNDYGASFPEIADYIERRL